MRQRTQTHLPNRATLSEPASSSATGTDALKASGGPEVVDEGVPCRFEPQSTSREHVEAGEYTRKPNTIVFPVGTDVEEGWQVEFEDDDLPDDTFEIREIKRTRDSFRGRGGQIVAEVERR